MKDERPDPTQSEKEKTPSMGFRPATHADPKKPAVAGSCGCGAGSDSKHDHPAETK